MAAKAPRPWHEIRHSAANVPALAPLGPASNTLAEMADGYVAGDPEAKESVYKSLKRAKQVARKIPLEPVERQRIYDSLLGVQKELERVRHVQKARKPKLKPDEKFATLAYAWAQGEPEDWPIVEPIGKRGALKVLNRRVHQTLERRKLRQQQEALLNDYHRLLFRVQRGEGDVDEERELVKVSTRLQAVEDQLNLGADGKLAGRAEEQKTVIDRLGKIERELRGIRQTLRQGRRGK